jgi:hypothetical protein
MAMVVLAVALAIGQSASPADKEEAAGGARSARQAHLTKREVGGDQDIAAGAPDGKYVIIQFDTSGYFIK